MRSGFRALSLNANLVYRRTYQLQLPTVQVLHTWCLAFLVLDGPTFVVHVIFRRVCLLTLVTMSGAIPLSSLMPPKICSACLLDTAERETSGLSTHAGGSGSNAGSGGKLYSLRVKIELPCPSSSTVRGHQEPPSPFAGGELVAVRSPRWRSSQEAPLGVVQSWDPVYDKHSHQPFGKDSASFIRVVVCGDPVGGDGQGGRGGWIPLSSIQDCSGKGKGGTGVPVSLVKGGSLMTACREFQAVMSVTSLPDHVRRCLVDPSVSKERKQQQHHHHHHRVPASIAQFHAGRANSGGSTDAKDADAPDVSPPSGVPGKLWKSLLEWYNHSQVRAIRKVAGGSPAGFTLLQVGREHENVSAPTKDYDLPIARKRNTWQNTSSRAWLLCIMASRGCPIPAQYCVPDRVQLIEPRTAISPVSCPFSSHFAPCLLLRVSSPATCW